MDEPRRQNKPRRQNRQTKPMRQQQREQLAGETQHEEQKHHKYIRKVIIQVTPK